MKPARLTRLTELIGLIALAMTGAIAVVGQSQTTNLQAAADDRSSLNKTPFEIVSQKIGSDYYPMLDRPNSMSAENGDMPMTETERMARQRNKTTKNVPAPIAPEDNRSRGRLRSYTRVIDNAQYVQIVVRNNGAKPVKIVEWDFAFPRYENGRLLSRYDVTANTEIKPGAKKTLKYKLPPGAKKCEVVKVISDENQPERVHTFEAVCGAGFNDPSLMAQKQETISIKRIEYADGSVWQRK
jgi:hypothetical protein